MISKADRYRLIKNSLSLKEWGHAIFYLSSLTKRKKQKKETKIENSLRKHLFIVMITK